MFSAGLAGYNVGRGLLGALKARAPKEGLVDELLEEADEAGCLRRLKGLALVRDIEVSEDAAQTERALRCACARQALKLRRVIGGSAGELLEAYTRHYDFHNVKVLFRAAMRGEAGVPEGLYPISPIYEAEKIRGLDTPGAVAQYFAGTRLGKAVGAAYEVYVAHDGDLSLFELALDSAYVGIVWRAGEKLYPADGTRVMKRVIEPWLGVVSVLWVLWLAKERGMGVEEIANLLALPRELLRAEALVKLVEKGDAKEVEGLVRSRSAQQLLSSGGLGKDMAEMHRAARRFIWRTVNPKGLRFVFDATAILTTLVRWEFIIEDAITIATCKSMGLSKEEIEGLLATKAA